MVSNESLLNQIKILNNQGDYHEALILLDSIIEEYSNNPYYCVRRGIALYQLHRENESISWFKKAQELGLEEIDEMPGTYLPKNVTKWLERAQIQAPRRIEKKAFEEERRAKRRLSPQDSNLCDFDFDGFWKDSNYALENYVGRFPTDMDIAKTEATLGYCLPASYKALIKERNGGVLAKDTFVNPLKRPWCVELFSVESIYGIDEEKNYSLCSDTGSKFWISEWGYADIGIAICDTITGGHDMIFLDYSDCGPEGEPCVVHIDQERDYEITYLADNFEEFVRGLISVGEDDGDDA